MSDVVSKKTLDEIVEEINQIDVTEIELNEKALEFLETLEAYIHCFEELEALYEKIDPDHQLAGYDLSNPNLQIQQVSNKTGEPVKNLVELYESAKATMPVFKATIESLLEQLSSSSGVVFDPAPLKGEKRASEKVQDDYSKKVPGPGESWLYDIVRGSLLFENAEQLFEFLEVLQATTTIVIVKFKNRFGKPTLSGYRDFNIQIQITNEEDGSKHICELQLHIKDIKKLAKLLKSHDHYEFLRKYFAGATVSVEERMNDLRAICQGGSLDMAFVAEVVKNPLDLDRMTRLEDLFKDYMNEYQLAIVITHAAKDIMEPQEWYLRLGNLLQRQGKLEEALTMHQTSLDIRLEKLGPEHTDVADCYNNMAIVLEIQGELEEAMKLYKKSLNIYLNALGPEHTYVADCYNNMAIVLQNQGESEEAMKHYKKALDVYLNALGPEHTLVATSYNGMATVLADQGEFEEAMKLYKKSHDIYVNALGPEHAHVAMSYNNMGEVLRKQGELEEAMKLSKKSLDIRVNALGLEHADVADCYNNMAYILDDQGELVEAMKFYKKALAIYLNALGQEHTLVAQCYYNISYVLENQDKLEEALSSVQKAREIYLQVFGPDDTDIIDCDERIAYIQNKLQE